MGVFFFSFLNLFFGSSLKYDVFAVFGSSLV